MDINRIFLFVNRINSALLMVVLVIGLFLVIFGHLPLNGETQPESVGALDSPFGELEPPQFWLGPIEEIEPLDFIAILAALVPKPRVNLTRYHGVFAPNSQHRVQVTPAKRGKGRPQRTADKTWLDKTPEERHHAMNWMQRLKRVFDIDTEQCEQCGGKVKVISRVSKIPQSLSPFSSIASRKQPQRASRPRTFCRQNVRHPLMAYLADISFAATDAVYYRRAAARALSTNVAQNRFFRPECG